MSRKTKPDPTSELATFKRTVIESLARDPLLARRLILKGGTALEIAYGIGERASIDIDYSIEDDFAPDELPAIESRMTAALRVGLESLGLHVLDLTLEPKPRQVSEELASFWGGYLLKFKVVTDDVLRALGDDLASLRRNAKSIGPSQRSTFEIDISRHERCPDPDSVTIGGATVFVYSPRLIVAEKLRAICQQTTAYRALVRSHPPRPRSRDFFDIHNLLDRFSLILTNRAFRAQVAEIFAAKRVPLELLWNIPNTLEFHRQDFDALKDTVPPGQMILTFDEYFATVATLVRRLQALGDM